MWRSWVPAFTGITLGISGSTSSIYRFDGDRVVVQLAITLGTGGAFGTNPSISLPVPAAQPQIPFQPYIGAGNAFISGSGYKVFAVSDNLSATSCRIWADGTGPGYQLVTASYPATWVPGSKLFLELEYTPASTVMPATFGAVGDSITAWSAAQNWNTQTSSWTNYVPTPSLCFAGGWAQGGATTTWMLTNSHPLLADTLVLMGGTNDIYNGTTTSTTLTNIAGIVGTAATTHTLLLAIPPYDAHPTDASNLNIALAALATSNGWNFLDPWGSFRTATGTYIPGAAVDGVHPTPATQQAAGLLIRAAL